MVASHLPHRGQWVSISSLCGCVGWGLDWDSDVGNTDTHYSVCPYSGAAYFQSLSHRSTISTAFLLRVTTLFQLDTQSHIWVYEQTYVQKEWFQRKTTCLLLVTSDAGQGRCSVFCVCSRLSQLNEKVRSISYKKVASRTTGACWETNTKQRPAGVCDLMT